MMIWHTSSLKALIAALSLSILTLTAVAGNPPCVQNKAGTACLSPKTPYVIVPGANQAPIFVKQPPSEVRDKLPIVHVTYDQLMHNHCCKKHPLKRLRTKHHGLSTTNSSQKN